MPIDSQTQTHKTMIQFNCQMPDVPEAKTTKSTGFIQTHSYICIHWKPNNKM